MQLSLTPILSAIELGFLFSLAWRCNRLAPVQGSMGPTYAYLVWITAYGIISGVLGARGVYVSDDILETLPGLWLLLIPLVVAVVPVVLFGTVRDGLRRIVDHTPWHRFAYFHALRVAALGTAYRTAIGEFPASFEIGVGIPDFLFGVSAFWIARRAQRDEISEKGFLAWNLVGVCVIVPAAPILLQLGLPGPIQLFTALPDARAVLTYPMSIAPMLGVPLFLLTNLVVAWRIWERGRLAGHQPALDIRS